MNKIFNKLKIIKIIFILIILFFQFGCARDTQKIIFKSEPSLPYAVGSRVDPTQIDLLEVLHKQNVKVVTMGQNYLISIPSVILFANQSPRLRWHSYDVLYTVACYLRQFRKVTVQVTSFSTECNSHLRQEALTRARARVVANYLWSQGIKSRFIFSSGVGNHKPMLCTKEGGDGSRSSRIEITFHDEIE